MKNVPPFEHNIGDIVYCRHVDQHGVIISYSLNKQFSIYVANIQWFNGNKDGFPVGSFYFQSLERAT